MEDYFAAKRRLFCDDDGAPATAIVNLDDHYGRRLRDDRPDAVGFAIEHPEAAYRARDVEISFAGARFAAETPDGPLALRSPLPGRFNVLNVLGAVAAARAVGVEPATIERAVPEAGRVPGRFEPVEEGQGFAVIVDYAHTPDSLENVLNAARELAGRGRVLCVFGCGGDRDRDKRPKMGRAGAELSDLAVITSDNPRSEDPEAIVAEVAAGAEAAAELEVVVDRREAIALALGRAGSGDTVVIAGKGHEQGQEFEAGRKIPFDDREVAREELWKLGSPA
jgi:UDP-N-acetylmuramoyl-L-alanyl-D-glutamate--2,6-diaminopimelate ligase